MAQKFMSPGVFTTEIDLSFLAQGVAGIGAVVIGRTPQGPAMLPTFVNGMDAFAATFGNPDPKLQLPYGAQNYLKNSAALTVVRVLGHADGTATTNGYVLPAISAIADSGANGQILAEIHHSGALSVVGVPLDPNNFIVNIAGGLVAVTASFLTSSANYIRKVLNTDPTKYSTYGHYVYRTFSYATPAASASWSEVEISGATLSFTRDFSEGISAWVKSQPLGGTEYNLFRVHTRDHGKATNDGDSAIKVMIANVRPSPSPTVTPYGTFDIIVRQFTDTDQKVVTIESFTGLTLDPSSKNYFLRAVGDQVDSFDTTQRKFITAGTWPAKSKRIWLETDPTVAIPAEALPFGHRGYTKGVWPSGSSVPSLVYQVNQYDRNGNLDPNIAWGVQFVSGGVGSRMKAFPNSALTSADPDFSLSLLTGSWTNGKQTWAYLPGQPPNELHSPVPSSASLYKFNLPMQGGFDGFDLRVDDPLYLNNIDDETIIGVVSAKRSEDTIANPDAFDMNLLAVPGINNIKITDHARQIVNNRGDAMYVMDITGASVVEAINGLSARQIDDNYTATYYPDVKLNDTVNNKIVRVAPSVAVLGAIAFNDRVGQPFFAPAGLNRGGLSQFNIIDVVDRLTFQDRDDLYTARINPIATFPNEGIVVWGQKTLQVKASALDRVNVRRLLIFAKKTIAAAAKMLLFEPNNPATWQRFINTVNPILAKIQQDQGLNRFKVVMDTSTNTSDLIDRNIMTGKIFLEPTRSAEFIDLSFIITNAGVSFGE